MTNPYEEYKNSTYGRTVDKLLAEQQEKTGWLDQKLGKKLKSNPTAN